jgi:hypothetical protein
VDTIRCSNLVGRAGQDFVAPEKFSAGLAQLFEAYLYARDAQRQRWDFAVSLGSLRAAGMGWNDLRWLVCKGYVQHARELTLPGDAGRTFRPEGEMVLHKRSHFVLTEAGARFVGSFEAARAGSRPSQAPVKGGNGQPRCTPASSAELPHWDTQVRELHVGGRLVKRFRVPSPNQERILAAFEEEGWPPRIDDPLPPHPEQEPKRRLRDTIKSLNRHQINRLLHLTGDGTGQGIRWEAATGSESTCGLP